MLYAQKHIGVGLMPNTALLNLCFEVSEQLYRGVFPLCPSSVVIDWLVSPLLFALVWPFGVGFPALLYSALLFFVSLFSPDLFASLSPANELVVIPQQWILCGLTCLSGPLLLCLMSMTFIYSFFSTKTGLLLAGKSRQCVASTFTHCSDFSPSED